MLIGAVLILPMQDVVLYDNNDLVKFSCMVFGGRVTNLVNDVTSKYVPSRHSHSVVTAENVN